MRQLRRTVISLLLALCLAVPAFAAYDADFEGGSLSDACLLEDGSLLVCDVWNKVVWHVAGDSAVRFAGNTYRPVGPDGKTDEAIEPEALYIDADSAYGYFMEPWAIVPFLDGYAVSDPAANVVRYATQAELKTLGGSGKAGFSNGIAENVSFNRPTGLAVDDSGYLYIADSGNGAIRRMSNTGNVTTWVTGLSEPTGLCWADGSLYAAETGKNRIVRITNGSVQVIAGVAVPAEEAGEYYGGFADGPVATAEFDRPQGVAVYGNDIYVSDTLNHAVRLIRGGRVYTVAESSDALEMPAMPRGMFITGGVLYVTDLSAGGIFSIPLTGKRFSDVSSDSWYEPYVGESVLRGLVQGTGAATFSPDVTTSRAMFTVMLSRVHRSADRNLIIDGDGTFADIKAGSWYAAPARWAIDAGIVNGSNGSFMPDAPVTREQAVTMLYRYAVMNGYDVSVGEDTNILSYNDAFDVSSWAMPAMQWACGCEMIQGSGGNLRPGSSATRAELVKILLCFMDAYSM